MADRLMTGFSRTNRIRLPEETINVDKSSVLGASTMSTLLKAQRTGDYSNVGNAMTIYGAVKEIDSTETSKDIFVKEDRMVTVVVDKKGVEHKLDTPDLVNTYCAKGFTIAKTIRERTLSDGTVKID